MSNELIDVHKTCLIKKSPECWKTRDYELDAEKYAAWREGMHIQDVWPHMSADDREFLISNSCGPCFDALFPEDDDES